MDKIDFVIPWVDGNDHEWQSEKRKYADLNGDRENIRFRDWDTLKYWFRGVEQYASWVNRIHLVTWGHLPTWLNTEHEKLHIVKHEDYIPKQYLPTFSSHTIELNLHRMEGLADKFVYFNDDMFLMNEAEPKDFFQKGLPCDMAVLYPISVGKSDVFSHILLNDGQLIEQHLDLKRSMKQHMGKWFSLSYGKSLIKTLCMMPFPEMSGIMMHHQPQPYLKETFGQVWEKGKETLDATCQNKFRCAGDVNQYVFRYWQLLNGTFTPSNRLRKGIYEEVGNEEKDYGQILNESKRIILCLNDAGDHVDFEKEKKKMLDAFQKKFPQKSSFEKDGIGSEE